MGSSKPSATLVIIALISVQILFGVNFVATKYIVMLFPPMMWTHVRVLSSAIIFMAIALASMRPHPPRSQRFFKPLFLYALLGVILNQSTFMFGMQLTTTTNGAVLNTLIPVFTIVIVILQGHEQLTVAKALGFTFALGGVLVIRKVEDFTLSSTTFVGDLLIICGALSSALFLAFGKRFIETYDRIWTNAWLFSYGAIGLTFMAAPAWHTTAPLHLSPLLMTCMVFSIVSTMGAYFLTNWSLAYARSSQVALFIYLQPVVASLIAWVWLGEHIATRTVMASALIFCGLLLSVSKNR